MMLLATTRPGAAVTSAIRTAVLVLLACAGGARAETPEEWVRLLTRVHGGFGSFLPVGIRIGEDDLRRRRDPAAQARGRIEILRADLVPAETRPDQQHNP